VPAIAQRYIAPADQSPIIPFAQPPELDPLGNWKASFNTFYEFVKGSAGRPGADQYIQLTAAALPLHQNPENKWYSRYNFLIKSDHLLDTDPVTRDFTVNERQFSDEFGRFLDRLEDFVDIQELPPDIVQKIAAANIRIQNIDEEVERLLDLHDARWIRYCRNTGTNPADRTMYAQWSMTYGNYDKIDKLLKEKFSLLGQISKYRSKVYSDPDHKEAHELYTQFNSITSRLRFPRFPDKEYPDGANFSPPYLANIPPGSTALFDDRHLVLQDLDVADMLTLSTGAFNQTLTSTSSATESMERDWGAGGNVSYGWIKVSANVSEHTAIREDFSKTTSMTVGVKSLLRVKVQTSPWFKAGVFNNGLVKKNLKQFQRFFGPKGTLLYYPIEMIVARGFYVKFTASQNWQYDYERQFSAGGSCGLSLWGIGFGANANYSERQEQHRVEKRGQELTFDDGEKNLRIVGFYVQKVDPLAKAFQKELVDYLDEVEKDWARGGGKGRGGGGEGGGSGGSRATSPGGGAGPQETPRGGAPTRR
jgi:hypothetical protein